MGENAERYAAYINRDAFARGFLQGLLLGTVLGAGVLALIGLAMLPAWAKACLL